MTLILIKEKKLGRLGRHIEHDHRSRAFAASHAVDSVLISAKHQRYVAPFDQGELGSCTCESMIGILMTGPFFNPSRILGQADCVSLYVNATRLDKIPGHYPPYDTGSSGLAAAKAAHKRGWLRAYHHAFSLHTALAALGHGPIMIGVNWYEGFDTQVGRNAELKIAGGVRGGHELEVSEIDVDRKLIRGPNSWGVEWGDAGYYTMSFDTLGRLLSEQGDCTIPVL